MIEVIKNILPEKINNKIILLLLKNKNWKIAKDFNDDLKLLDDMLNNNEISYGNSLVSYSTDPLEKVYLESELNNYAEIIYEIIKNHTKYKFFKPLRFYWNFYNKAAAASIHIDMAENHFVSFIYNLNTNNGGTNINGEFFKSKAGEAIVFESNLLHSSITQTDSTARFNLNCIVELERHL
jgi:hypothetical protein